MVDAEQRVVGFYAAASGAVMHHEVAGKVRRNQPEPIPIVMLGRLAVDLKHRQRGLGAALLKHFLPGQFSRCSRITASNGFVERDAYPGSEIWPSIQRHWLFFERSLDG